MLHHQTFAMPSAMPCSVPSSGGTGPSGAALAPTTPTARFKRYRRRGSGTASGRRPRRTRRTKPPSHRPCGSSYKKTSASMATRTPCPAPAPRAPLSPSSRTATVARDLTRLDFRRNARLPFPLLRGRRHGRDLPRRETTGRVASARCTTRLGQPSVTPVEARGPRAMPGRACLRRRLVARDCSNV